MRSVTIGEGRPALLIPGADLGHEFYAPLGEALAKRGICTRILTLPGFMGAPALPRSSLEALLEALSETLTAQRELRGMVIGHSFGGLLALCLAARSPERVDRLLLLEPAVIPSAWIARRAAKKYQREVVLAPRGEFRNWSGTFRRVHDLERFPQAAIDHYLAVRRGTDPKIMGAWLDDLPSLYPLPLDQITMPTLILRGASSGPWARLGLHRLAAALPQASLQTIAGAGHWLANERDEAIAEAIARFGA